MCRVKVRAKAKAKVKAKRQQLSLRVFVRVAFAGEFVSTGAFTAADLIVDAAGDVTVVDPSTTFDGCPAR
jgi:hypothetical protein